MKASRHIYFPFDIFDREKERLYSDGPLCNSTTRNLSSDKRGRGEREMTNRAICSFFPRHGRKDFGTCPEMTFPYQFLLEKSRPHRQWDDRHQICLIFKLTWSHNVIRGNAINLDEPGPISAHS